MTGNITKQYFSYCLNIKRYLFIIIIINNINYLFIIKCAIMNMEFN